MIETARVVVSLTAADAVAVDRYFDGYRAVPVGQGEGAAQGGIGIVLEQQVADDGRVPGLGVSRDGTGYVVPGVASEALVSVIGNGQFDLADRGPARSQPGIFRDLLFYKVTLGDFRVIRPGPGVDRARLNGIKLRRNWQ